MKKPIIIIFILLCGFVANAQKNDTTIYYGCKIKGDTTTYIGQQANNSKQVSDCSFYSAPRFPGGENDYSKFLAKNLHWVSSADEWRGKVIVEFVVEKNGQLSNIKILRPSVPELDSEVLRVIRLSPKWIPATYHGKVIRYRYTVPVSFTLDD